MSDAVNPPPNPESTDKVDPTDYSWADEWLHENDDAHLPFRKDGLDALKAYRADQASPLQKGVVEVNLAEIKTANADYIKQLGEAMYQEGPETDKVIVEKVGLDLQAINNGDIRPALLDVVTPGDTPVPEQPQEGEK